MIIHPLPSNSRCTDPSQTNASIENESIPTERMPLALSRLCCIKRQMRVILPEQDFV